MVKDGNEPIKAYKNLEFLNSPDARTIRIQAEFLEPMRRFKKEKIEDTIVFFGSARTKSLQDATIEMDRLEDRIAKDGVKVYPALQEELEFARNQIFLARFYEDAVELSRRLTEWSKGLNSVHRFVVCSGGGPGMMEAANKGAFEAGGKSVGLSISLPMEESANPFITRGLSLEFHYFFMRKFWFIYLAKALVIFPGGFGTLDELFETLTLIQTGKVLKKMPILIYGTEYWNQIINFGNMAKYGVISKTDLDLLHFSDSVDDAFDYLKKELTRLYLDIEAE
ncbi:MAG: TIGR00730 family Rossman fold protein [Dethiobacteria bacterium]|nr:TIGR00730 family Rossman fold protein [Dethiobacteria bacterium]